ncbi:MAG TPA: hypothetical protein VI138_06595 [Candidatus Dormibacteraeota bacterium]
MSLAPSAETGLDPAHASLLAEAGRRFGTPCYVTDLAELDSRARVLATAFPDPFIRQYSLKANPLPALVARLGSSGWGANVVSLGEWAAARAAGLGNHLITLEGIGKTDAELGAAVQAVQEGAPLRWVTLESSDEADQLRVLAASPGLGAGQGPDVLLRLNPEVSPETIAQLSVGVGASKFGMAEPELRQLARASRDSGSPLRIRGVHVHIGSQLSGTDAWVEAALQACRIVRDLAQLAPGADTVDLGGGFPAGEVTKPEPAEFRSALDRALAGEGLALPDRVAVEPGRYLVATAGWIVARVLHVRPGRLTQQVVIDASFAELVRPALYGARHEIVALRPSSAGSEDASTVVEGALCESTNTFGLHRLPRLRRGELVAIANAGAYSSSMFSSYNGRQRPAEVLIDDQALVLARPAMAFLP